MKSPDGDQRSGADTYILLLVPVGCAYLFWSWTHQLVGFGGDNALYVLMAQAYSPYGHPANEVASYFAGHSQFPPLYPLVLALFDGGYDLLIAHLVTTACLLTAFPLLMTWARALDLPMPVGFLVTIAFALLPGTYAQTLYLHSENLYLLLTLLLFNLTATQNPPIRHQYAAAVVAAAVTLTRSAGLTLVVAYFCYLARNRHRRWIWQASVAIIPMIAWNIYAYTLGSHYVNSVLPDDGGDLFARLAARVAMQWSALKYGWLVNMSGSGVLSVYSIALGAMCLIGSVVRLFLWRIDGVYVAAYFVLLLLWPFPAEAARFMIVIVPILLVQGAWLAHTLISRVGQPKYSFLAGLAVPLIALMVALPDVALTLQRFQIALPVSLEAYRRDPSFVSGTQMDAVLNANMNRALVTAIKSLSDDVPEGECIFAIKPSIVGYFSGRVSKAPPGSALSESDFRSALDRAGCRHFLLMNMASPTFNTPFYPLNRLHNRIRILRSYHLTDDAASPVVAQIGELIGN